MKLTLGSVRSRPSLEEINKSHNTVFSDLGPQYLGKNITIFLDAWALRLNSINHPKIALSVCDILVGVHWSTK